MSAVAYRRPVPEMGAGRQPYAYNRRSKFRVKDLDVEVTRAVHRQRDDADAACADRGWGEPVHITDEGQSASRFAARERDGWPVLLDAIRDGRVSYVLVWLLDRIIRQTRDLDDLLDACRETGTLILQTGTGTVIDPDDPDSVAMAKIQGVLAETEVAKMSKRVRRAHAEKARLGQFHGGRRRFGYNADMTALDVAEAAIVSRIADDLIGGRSLHSIAKELNADGTPPPMWKGVPFAMGEWTGSNLGSLMRRPHLAGMRVHKGAIVGEGSWPAIIEPERWATLQAVLSEPSRRVSPTSTARKHLLSGLIDCGVCGKPLRMRAAAGPGKPAAYACPDNHVHRSLSLVDGVVSGALCKVLARPDFHDVWTADDDTDDRTTLEGRIATIEDALDDWAAREMAGTATRRQVERVTVDGMAEIARLRGLLDSMAARRAVPVVLREIGGNPDAAAVWDALSLDRRRAIIKAMCSLTLQPAERKGARFDPRTVHIAWRIGE